MTRVALVRADASATIGHGHVMRCLALAAALREQGFAVEFLQRRQAGDAFDAVARAGFAAHAVPAPDPVEAASDARACHQVLGGRVAAELLVLDHYRLGADWVARMRAHARCVLVIDDLADRALGADLLLDQNWHDEPAQRYRGWLPPGALMLFGPGYALLRAEFATARAGLRVRDGRLRRVVIAFGGSDPADATGACVDAIHAARPDLQLDVIIGAGAPQAAALQARWSSTPGVEVTRGAQDIARRFALADVFVGAGGSMTWERACLGLPGITLPIADNQQALCQRLAQAGEGIDLGLFRPAALQALMPALQSLDADPARLRAMGQGLAARCDGQGAARVARAVVERLAAAQAASR